MAKKAKRYVEIPDFISFLVKKGTIYDLDVTHNSAASLPDLLYRNFGVVRGHSGEYEFVELRVNQAIRRFRGDPYPKLYEITDSLVSPTEVVETDDLDAALGELFDRVGRGYKNAGDWAKPKDLLIQLLGEFYDFYEPAVR